MTPINVIGYDYFIKNHDERIDNTTAFPVPSIEPDFDRLDKLNNRNSLDSIDSPALVDLSPKSIPNLEKKKIISDIVKILAIIPGVGTIIGLTRFILTLSSKELTPSKKKNLVIRSFFEILNLGILILPFDIIRTLLIHKDQNSKEKMI